jgi:hypothetical protein
MNPLRRLAEGCSRETLIAIVVGVLRGSAPAKPPRRRGPGRPRKRGWPRKSASNGAGSPQWRSRRPGQSDLSPARKTAARPNRQHGTEDALNLPLDGA